MALMAISFSLQPGAYYFATSALNYPKITLDTLWGQWYRLIRFTRTFPSPNFNLYFLLFFFFFWLLIFYVQLPVFDLQAILAQCAEWPQNELEYYKVESVRPKFHSISIYIRSFSDLHFTYMDHWQKNSGEIKKNSGAIFRRSSVFEIFDSVGSHVT